LFPQKRSAGGSEVERRVRPHDYGFFGLPSNPNRAMPVAATNATTNAGTAIMIGQMTSARMSNCWLPVAVLSV
jgi:hypothetical protein